MGIVLTILTCLTMCSYPPIGVVLLIITIVYALGRGK